MSQELQVFNFDSHDIRRVMVGGNPWAVAKDVAEAIGISWQGGKTIAHVPTEWRGVGSVPTPSGDQEMALLSKQGLLFFLGRSDKPKALAMQKWAWGTVIPEVLETGSFSVAPAASSALDRFASQAALWLEALGGKTLELEAKVETTQAEVRQVEARIEQLAEAASPEKIAGQIEAKVHEAEAIRDANERSVMAMRKHLKGLVRNLVVIRTERLGSKPKNEFPIVWHIAFAATPPCDRLDDMRHVSQFQAAIGAIERHLIALGITPPPAPPVAGVVAQQSLDGFGGRRA